ncbi:MAG: carboxylesterase family protein [Saprospiraceae bacterium]|nr:carboxylesterase family protein [Saprospiraceae bacterium]
MRFPFICSIFLFIGTGLRAQTASSTRSLLDPSHPGILFLLEEKSPGSPFDAYYVYVPKSSKERQKKYPVLIFLHGGSLVGGDATRVLDHDLPKAILESSRMESELDVLLRDSFVVVIPHLSNGEFYYGADAIRSLVDQMALEENVNPNRVYLTGLSRGGYGTWGLASRMADFFAAIAPICGGAGGITDYGHLESLPIWVTHNTPDRIVPYEASDRIVRRLESKHGMTFHKTTSIEESRFEEFDLIFTSNSRVSHDAWTEMHSSPNFFKWLLRF